MSVYTYTPLRNPKNIRLVYLHPTETTPPASHTSEPAVSDIWVSIKEVGIDQTRYSALSYCWGQGAEKELTEPIVVESGGPKTINITPSLFTALKHFRGSETKILWIDAICINQNDKAEKGVQVGRMADIYYKAADVLIWLGEAHTASDAAMNFVQEISVLGLDRLAQDKSKGGAWRGLAALMRRPWFGRRWIIQEVAFAKKAELWCGHASVSWDKFAEAVTLFEKKIDEINGLFRTLKKKEKTMNKLRRAGEYAIPVATVGAAIAVQAFTRGGIQSWMKPAAMSIGQMWNKDVKGKSEQKSDWQWEFPIGQVRDVGAHSLVTNLERIMKRNGPSNKYPEHICSVEALLSYLPTFQAGEPADVVFAIISLAKKPHRIVPDYTKSLPEVCKEVVQDAVTQSSSLNIICRPWAPKCLQHPTWITRLSQYPFAENSEGYYARVVADPLIGPPGRCPYKASGSDIRPLVTFGGDKSQFTITAKGFQLEVIRSLQPAASVGTIPASWCSYGSGIGNLLVDPSTSDYVKDNYWRTLVGNRDGQGELPPSWMRRACVELYSQSRIINTVELLKISESTNVENAISGEARAFVRRLQSVTWNRRLTRLGDGSFVLVPEGAGVGDRLVVLYGCDVPVILRKCSDGLFKFVGEAYVHGCMDGEALQRTYVDEEFQLK